MGQQQLLLVILVTIIVGIATVVAINIFGTAADQANRDAVRQDLLAASVQAQGVWARPALMDGANRDFQDFGAARLLEALNIPTNDPNYTPGTDTQLDNENGQYVLAVTDVDAFTLTATPSSGGADIVLTLSREGDPERWVVDIDGSSTVDEN